jgi:nitrite reductase (NADH) large subunit
MVGHRLVAELTNRREGQSAETFAITVIGEEPRPAYDRVALSSLFDGATSDDLAIGTSAWYEDRGVELVLNTQVMDIDRESKKVTTDTGNMYAYDTLVMATGSYPFVPPIEGNDLPGCFVYRTIDDLAAIRSYAQRGDVRVGAVIGGGLLGLEAANALRLLDLETHVVEFAPRLMPLQLCEGGSSALRRRIAEMGIEIHTSTSVQACIDPAGTGSVRQLHTAEGPIDADLVVFSAGIRPRDELARLTGLSVGERGGIVVDRQCRTSDDSVFAIGECALAAGRVWGLVAPGYDMARVVARTLRGEEDAGFDGADLSTKLKLLGVDVASFGDPFRTEGVRDITWNDAATNVFRRIVVSDDGTTMIGGVLVGDVSSVAELGAMVRSDLATPNDVRVLVLPEGSASSLGAAAGGRPLPDACLVCSCNNISAGTIRMAMQTDGLEDLTAVKQATTAGTGCGGCVPMVKQIVEGELVRIGKTVSRRLCSHFNYSREQLFDIVRIQTNPTFAGLLQSHGEGSLGCEICRPTVASMLSSLSSGYILDGEQAALQDTNDHFLANLQKDGTYSVIPRVPGGEITAAQLIVIGQVANDFGLYCKITGGQRIDLLGATVDQLPAIWSRLVDAGMESGHAYGKALRTVKSCVGQVWCRYGVQDSTALAIQLELRYRGLRAPHKVKMAVSGCVRECAEAQSKDIGVIATERGWNLWVCGNGGARPRHASLLAEDLDTPTLIATIDRFFAFYIQTADRLERTSSWIDRRPGGVDELREIVCNDSLGIAADLEAVVERHVASYECEWKATLDRPDRLVRFTSAVGTVDRRPDSPEWTPVIDSTALTIDRSVAVRVDEQSVAVLRTSTGVLAAVGNTDPFSGADVMSRGLVGNVAGRTTLASPMYKQRFDVETGECLDDPGTSLPVFGVREIDGRIEIRVPAEAT